MFEIGTGLRGAGYPRMLSLVVAPLLALACTSEPTGSGGSGNDDPVTTAGSGPGIGGSQAVADAPSAGYVRRLTHLEYDHTIVDLLGVDAEHSANFETDLAQDGFTNNSAAQNVSPTLAE